LIDTNDLQLQDSGFGLLPVTLAAVNKTGKGVRIPEQMKLDLTDVIFPAEFIFMN